MTAVATQGQLIRSRAVSHLEVIKHVLFVGLAASIAPVNTILATTSEVGLGIHTVVAS